MSFSEGVENCFLNGLLEMFWRQDNVREYFAELYPKSLPKPESAISMLGSLINRYEFSEDACLPLEKVDLLIISLIQLLTKTGGFVDTKETDLGDSFESILTSIHGNRYLEKPCASPSSCVGHCIFNITYSQEDICSKCFHSTNCELISKFHESMTISDIMRTEKLSIQKSMHEINCQKSRCVKCSKSTVETQRFLSTLPTLFVIRLIWAPGEGDKLTRETIWNIIKQSQQIGLEEAGLLSVDEDFPQPLYTLNGMIAMYPGAGAANHYILFNYVNNSWMILDGDRVKHLGSIDNLVERSNKTKCIPLFLFYERANVVILEHRDRGESAMIPPPPRERVESAFPSPPSTTRERVESLLVPPPPSTIPPEGGRGRNESVIPPPPSTTRDRVESFLVPPPPPSTTPVTSFTSSRPNSIKIYNSNISEQDIPPPPPSFSNDSMKGSLSKLGPHRDSVSSPTSAFVRSRVGSNFSPELSINNSPILNRTNNTENVSLSPSSPQNVSPITMDKKGTRYDNEEENSNRPPPLPETAPPTDLLPTKREARGGVGLSKVNIGSTVFAAQPTERFALPSIKPAPSSTVAGIPVKAKHYFVQQEKQMKIGDITLTRDPKTGKARLDSRTGEQILVVKMNGKDMTSFEECQEELERSREEAAREMISQLSLVRSDMTITCAKCLIEFDLKALRLFDTMSVRCPATACKAQLAVDTTTE